MFSEINSRILQYLKPFSYVVEQQSIHRASELLFQSPSAVSQQIAKLEEELGTRLFERSKGQKLKLLPAGQRLYELLPSMDNAIFRLRSDLKTFQSSPCPPFRMGVLPLLRTRLMGMISSYSQETGALPFALTEDNDGTALCNSILAGDLDCAFLWEDYIHETLIKIPLFTSPLVFACHSSLITEFGPEPTMEQLCSLPLVFITIVYRRAPNLDAYSNLPLTGPRLLQVDNPLAALEAVRNRLGTAIICEEAMLNERDQDIRIFPLEGGRYFRKIALAVSRRDLKSEHSSFIQYMRQSCSK